MSDVGVTVSTSTLSLDERPAAVTVSVTNGALRAQRIVLRACGRQVAVPTLVTVPTT